MLVMTSIHVPCSPGHRAHQGSPFCLATCGSMAANQSFENCGRVNTKEHPFPMGVPPMGSA